VRVGVVMPTYNQAQFLPEALAAVSRQDYASFCVVNDGSTDDTARILRDGLFWTVEQENAGCAAAINRGVDSLPASCDALTWVSSDNVMAPEWLSALSAAMRPGVGAVYSAFDMDTETGKRVTVRQGKYDPARLVSSENCYFGPSFLIRREVWEAAGPHRGGASHDYDHWARVEEACWARGLTIGYVDTPLCFYRTHPDQTVKRRPDLYDAGHWRAEALARRAQKA
jgi:glycosyltransferase involved in cell wall biosynthesis